MNCIQVLDCTLRDGGYCNECKFDSKNIKKIVNSLVESNIDIIECGFLTNKVIYNPDVTKFTMVEQFLEFIPENRKNKLFVALMNYGEYDPDRLPECDGTSLDGIRVAFHKKDFLPALDVCKKIKAKGYKVFIQDMVSLSYTDEEYLNLIRLVNELEPFAFYIVDSFGEMKQRDLMRLFYIVEHNLKANIRVGFHSHNNMQLAYSNAQSLVDFHTRRNLIIDSSVYGMGRGAGNLNTELFVEYLNDISDEKYYLKPLLTIIDEILNEFYQRNYWGYSLPNYVSAVHGAHPNYAGYLDDKKTLTVEAMNEIFDMMDKEKRVSYDKDYIEGLYLKYMTFGKAQEEKLSEFKKVLKDKTILLIAPGKSAFEEEEKIVSMMNNPKVISISVNFSYQGKNADYIFVSNLRRYRELDKSKRNRCIVTSNISASEVYLKVDYAELLNDFEAVQDNAGLMAINFFIKQGARKILLAGFDGYSHDIKENYVNEQTAFTTRESVLDLMNEGMEKVLQIYKNDMTIDFLTEVKNIKK